MRRGGNLLQALMNLLSNKIANIGAEIIPISTYQIPHLRKWEIYNLHGRHG